ncbi:MULTISPECIES: DUF58 domain-containing protein [unclassified Arthrobacter]|uniref:DUF58 domain-containing protein n=1 Tax=unclassified Arthrobacter TaxID=235627 RepID=UPI001EF06654|nr:MULTISPECIES: DUF58 domain-containing protein [unclassified Arthrobacter]UKA72466.1 DUF58 domain-containing protein [Arthrobacter sp. FW306-06-A]UKA76697.1 DUF58 domain-containing protein [Arthrobacter sp. FW306-07-I]
MALLDKLPRHLFTRRGWGMLAAGAFTLAAAQVMGRRDLLTLALLLLVLPLVCLAGVRLVKPRFRVYREFNPSPVETSAPAAVHLAVARSGPGSGRVAMEERLPAQFGHAPAFRFPSRSATGGTSRYEYHLTSRHRGQFRIGPVTAEFTDPFGLALHRQAIDDGDVLTVTPAAVALPATLLAGARGNDGVTATRVRANPSDDDVMTREYRHGDPMRRVHWAATARHGALMVRQEESVTTPEATIILDHRSGAFAGGPGTAMPGLPGQDGHALATSGTFEWAVVAAMSISAHLAERNYSLRLLDTGGNPAFLHSPSSPDPGAEEFSGTSGLQSIAESLAAIHLSGTTRPRRDGVLRDMTGRNPQAEVATGTRTSAGNEQEPPAFDDHLMDKISAHRMRGPLIAVLGRITAQEAAALAPAAASATNAMALVAVERPAEYQEVLEVLRQAGWRAVAVAPKAQLAAVWGGFDQDLALPTRPAPEAGRGAGVAR